jgi:hypothetical protein
MTLLIPTNRPSKGFRLPCGHRRVRVAPTLGSRDKWCVVCRTTFTVTVEETLTELDQVRVRIEPVVAS